MTETKALALKDNLKNLQPEYAKLLKASGTDPDKFINNAIMAVADNADIQSGEVASRSVFNVCSRAANDGVMLDGRQAALVVGWNGRLKKKEAQYRLMAAGVMEMIKRSPNIKRTVCQIVYEKDDFEIDFVTDGVPVLHKVNVKSGRGEPIGCYFVAELTGGGWTQPEYMAKEEIEYIRDNFVQKNKAGEIVSMMWLKMPLEAWKKTVLHRAKKWLPLGERELTALNHDEESGLVDVTPEPEQVAEPEKKPDRKKSVAEKVKEKAAEAPPHDPETGEIIEAEVIADDEEDIPL